MGTLSLTATGYDINTNYEGNTQAGFGSVTVIQGSQTNSAIGTCYYQNLPPFEGNQCYVTSIPIELGYKLLD